MAKLKPGKYVIVPGDPGRSEMIRRLKLNEPNDRISCQHVLLSGDEISILARLIKQGAHWATTWLFALIVYTRNQEDKLVFHFMVYGEDGDNIEKGGFTIDE